LCSAISECWNEALAARISANPFHAILITGDSIDVIVRSAVSVRNSLLSLVLLLLFFLFPQREPLQTMAK
jgi:hypothetical protein